MKWISLFFLCIASGCASNQAIHRGYIISQSSQETLIDDDEKILDQELSEVDE